MEYSQEELGELWDILKNKVSASIDNPKGLVYVPFKMGLKKFKKEHKKRTHLDVKSKVLTNLDQVISELEEGEILFHHMSCATTISPKDRALCIHLGTMNSMYALAIPGIGYSGSIQTYV